MKSQAHSLLLMIPQHYPIQVGELYAGEYPGHQNPKIARERIAALVEMGVRTFVDLTTGEDGLVPYEGILQDLKRDTGVTLRRISLPVKDMSVPDSPEMMRRILDALKSSTPAVYFHCWGGIGRTGTVTGCWLRECGLDGDASLARVQELYSIRMGKVIRHPQSPQTKAQVDYVKSWCAEQPQPSP